MPTREQFEQRLQEMWLAAGCPQGRQAFELWQRTYVLLMAELLQCYGKRDGKRQGERPPALGRRHFPRGFGRPLPSPRHAGEKMPSAASIHCRPTMSFVTAAPRRGVA